MAGADLLWPLASNTNLCRIAGAGSVALDPQLLGDQEQRPALHLLVHAAEILAEHAERDELDARDDQITPEERQVLANNLKELAQLVAEMGDNRTKSSLIRRGDDLDRDAGVGGELLEVPPRPLDGEDLVARVGQVVRRRRLARRRGFGHRLARHHGP